MKKKHEKPHTPAVNFDVQVKRDNNAIGRLHFADNRLVRHLCGTAPVLRFSGDGGDVEPVREFIAHRYHQAFDACINVTFPELVWISSQCNKVIAAVGLREASCNRLFLEQYTGAPIETLLPTSRAHIVEIGNLVSRNRSATIALFCCVALVLERRGIHYATATGTHFLEHQLRALGMSLKRLCIASDRQLANSEQQWGQYYETNPHVLAGSVTDCAQHLRSTLRVSLGKPHPTFSVSDTEHAL